MRLLLVTIAGACLAAGAAVQGQSAEANAPAQAATHSSPSAVPTSARDGASTREDVEKQLAALQKRMLDWPALAYYRDRDAATPPPARGEQRVVFLGDSITEMWGRRGSAFFPGKPYINRGISGQTSPQMVLRFHQDVVDLHPRVVVILAGTNDIAEKTGPMTPEMTLDNLRAMVEMARANGIRPVICSIPPDADFYWNKGLSPAPKIREWNAKLEAWAKSQNVVWVDYYTPLADANGGMKDGMSLDGTHPTPAGYAVMAPLAEAGIAKALGQ